MAPISVQGFITKHNELCGGIVYLSSVPLAVMFRAPSPGDRYLTRTSHRPGRMIFEYQPGTGGTIRLTWDRYEPITDITYRF